MNEIELSMKENLDTAQTSSLQLYLVRHGESCWNAEHRLTGWSDIPLTEKGRAQARSIKPLLEGLHFDGVWSSDLIRASDTARLAYAEPVEDARLRELFFGDFEGVVWTRLDPQYKNMLLDFESFRSPGGESLQEVRARVMGFVEELTPGSTNHQFSIFSRTCSGMF